MSSSGSVILRHEKHLQVWGNIRQILERGIDTCQPASLQHRQLIAHMETAPKGPQFLDLADHNRQTAISQ